MSALFGLYPFLLKLYADSGYQGPKFQQGLKRVRDQINVEIVKRSDLGKFIVLPRRWIVERSIGWLNRCRRLAKDWECLNRNGLEDRLGADPRYGCPSQRVIEARAGGSRRLSSAPLDRDTTSSGLVQ